MLSILVDQLHIELAGRASEKSLPVAEMTKHLSIIGSYPGGCGPGTRLLSIITIPYVLSCAAPGVSW